MAKAVNAWCCQYRGQSTLRFTSSGASTAYYRTLGVYLSTSLLEYLALRIRGIYDLGRKAQIPHLTLLGAVCVLSGGVRVSTRGDA